MSKQNGEDVFSVDIDAVLERVGEYDCVSGFGCIQNGVEITGFGRQEMISGILEEGRRERDERRNEGRTDGKEGRKVRKT